MAESTKPSFRAIQFLAITAPALYTGFTFAYSHVAMPPLITHAPPSLLAKQWLQAYRVAPPFVFPLIILGTLSNATLSYLCHNSARLRARTLYAIAALLTASIVPYTALYMEPGVNGAGKWKAKEILGKDVEGGIEEGELKGRGQVGTEKDTARDVEKKWAESVEMRDVVVRWRRENAFRYMVTGAAVLGSGIAMMLA